MGRSSFGGMLTPGVKGLLIALGGVYLVQIVFGRELIYFLGMTPKVFWTKYALWQPVTYIFLHGGLLHLLFNMLALWMFGGTLESIWGTNRFLKYFFLTGIGAGVSNCILTPDLAVPIIGASGAVYGLLAAYGIIFPNTLIFIYGLFPVKAKYLVLIFGLLEFVSSVSPGSSAVAHLVHLGGMIIGIIYLKKDYLIRWGAHRTKSYLKEREHIQAKKTAEAEEKLRGEVDDLLDKINEVGIENLTSWEKRRLQEASEKLRQKEKRES